MGIDTEQSVTEMWDLKGCTLKVSVVCKTVEKNFLQVSLITYVISITS
jgi:hypothetical protein